MAIRHVLSGILSNRVHSEPRSSIHCIRQELGTEKSSQKNTNEFKRRKSVSRGVNSKLPSNTNSDKGKPHHIRMGSDIRVRNSWTYTKRNSQCHSFVSFVL